MRRFRLIVIMGVLFLCPVAMLPQERVAPSSTVASAADSSRDKNFMATNFNRAFDTYTWLGAARYGMSIGPLTFSLKELFQSTLVQTDSRRITDQQSFDILGKYWLNSTISSVVKLSSISVSDNQSIGITNVFSNAGYGGLEFRPMEHFYVTPLIGFRYEKQSNERDRGMSYALDVDADSLMYDGYNTILDGKFQYDKLSPRVNEFRTLGIHTEKIFFERTRNLFSIVYNRNRRDFYSPADPSVSALFHVASNIESRSEDGITASDTLDYNIGNSFLMSFEGNVFTRTIERDTKYRIFFGNTNPVPNTNTQEMKIEGGVQAEYDVANNLSVNVRFVYQERDEQHRILPEDSISLSSFNSLSKIEESKNNHSRRALLSSQVTWAFSTFHSVSLTGSSSIIRYDTPSQENVDDHDELFYIVGLITTHHLNRYLDLTITANVNLTHLVYLSGQRSADNTWNRIFQLSPRAVYKPTNSISTINVFEVLANYTSYDFEYPGSPIRSFAFRQFRFLDSTSIALTQKLRIELFSHLRFYERGEFQWAAFAERPLDYFEDKTFIDAIAYNFTPSLLFSVGIRYFSQSRFAYTGQERQLQSFLRSIGPLTSILWRVSGRTEFSLNGWYEGQSQTGLANRSFANLTMSLSVHL